MVGRGGKCERCEGVLREGKECKGGWDEEAGLGGKLFQGGCGVEVSGVERSKKVERQRVWHVGACESGFVSKGSTVRRVERREGKRRLGRKETGRERAREGI